MLKFTKNNVGLDSVEGMAWWCTCAMAHCSCSCNITWGSAALEEIGSHDQSYAIMLPNQL